MDLCCNALFPFGLPPFKATPFRPLKGACAGLPPGVSVAAFQLERLEETNSMIRLSFLPFLNAATTVVVAGGGRHVRVPVQLEDVANNMIGFEVEGVAGVLEEAVVVILEQDGAVYGWRRLQVQGTSISVVPLAHASRHRVFPLDVHSPKAWGRPPLNLGGSAFLQLTFREAVPEAHWALHALALNALRVRDATAQAEFEFPPAAVAHVAAKAAVPLDPAKQFPDRMFNIEIGMMIPR